jgi:lysozyme family protein
MQNNFEKSLALVLKSEGGFTTDVRDNGNKLPDGRAGSTNLGVTQANWEAFVGHPVSWNDMKALNPTTVAPFYKRKYWDLVRGDDLPAGLDYLAFDFAVNAGPGMAIKTIQKAIGVAQDGAIGPITLSAIRAIPATQLIERFSDAKEVFYKGLKQFPIYGKGWLSRVAHVEVDAMHMVA